MTTMIFSVRNALARHPSMRLASPVSFDLKEREQLAIMGPNASGKTLLVDMLTGKSPLLSGSIETCFSSIRYIAFRDSYGAADDTYYYQQRWNIGDQGNIPTVCESLGLIDNDPWKKELLDLFHLNSSLDKSLIMLSSGELRKFRLMKALITHPQVLILDNPFIGLDEATRDALSRLLSQLADERNLSIVLILSMLDDVPSFITHVLPVRDKKVGEKCTVADYLSQRKQDTFNGAITQEEAEHILQLPYSDRLFDSDEVIRMDSVQLRYGDRVIFKDLNWLVRRAEKWSLNGENGAGKSALLSMVCADNPQSYACRINLFGRKRGSGESIWEIKKHIGYISPEMHRAFMKDIPALNVVAGGWNDNIGLYAHLSPEQWAVCEDWMRMLGVESLKDRPFLQLSSGEQRLCLLARAFVKDPELLILDEPLHGLDTYNRQRVKSIVETFCRRRHKTLIMATHYPQELPNSINRELFLKK